MPIVYLSGKLIDIPRDKLKRVYYKKANNDIGSRQYHFKVGNYYLIIPKDSSITGEDTLDSCMFKYKLGGIEEEEVILRSIKLFLLDERPYNYEVYVFKDNEYAEMIMMVRELRK